MPTESDPNEPRCRRTIFIGFRQACKDLWGDAGLQAVAARMSEETRRVCIEAPLIGQEMLPERYVLEWYDAAFKGAAGGSRKAYHGFLDRMMDIGFGRVRKVLLAMATPHLLGEKSADLWRHDHTHGTLTYRKTGDRSLTLTLADHPYLSTDLGRDSIAEIYRYAMSLARSTPRSTAITQPDGSLLVSVTW